MWYCVDSQMEEEEDVETSRHSPRSSSRRSQRSSRTEDGASSPRGNGAVVPPPVMQKPQKPSLPGTLGHSIVTVKVKI